MADDDMVVDGCRLGLLLLFVDVVLFVVVDDAAATGGFGSGRGL